MSDPLHPNEARRIIGPHEPNLRETFDAALGRYLRQDPADRAAYSLHAEASVLNSFMLLEAKRIFADVPRLRFIKSKRLELLDIEDRVLLRFKRLDDSFRTCNVPTRQSIGYSQQDELAGLPPATTKFNAGYRLNELRTGYVGLWITCPGLGGILYMWSILGPEQGELVPPLTPEMPFTPQALDRPAVRVKRMKKAEEDDGPADSGG